MTMNKYELKIPVMGESYYLAAQLFLPEGKSFDDLKTMPSFKRLIAYHGWADNSGSFLSMAPHLTNQGFALLALDSPGCGLSEHKPASVPYNDFDEIPLIAQVADSVGWDKFSVVAHSRGGGISACFVGAFSERVEYFLVFENTFGVTGRWYSQIIDSHNFHIKRMRGANKQVEKNLKRDLRVFHTIEEAILNNKNNPDFKKSYESAKNITLRHMRPCKGGVTFVHDKRIYGMQQFNTITEDILRQYLTNISCPVYVILMQNGYNDFNGTRDIPEIVKTTVNDRLHCVKDLKVDFVKGGHHLHSDLPELSSKMIIDFMYARENEKQELTHEVKLIMPSSVNNCKL